MLKKSSPARGHDPWCRPESPQPLGMRMGVALTGVVLALSSLFQAIDREPKPLAVITVTSGFDIQMRLVGHSALYHMVLTH